jgi:hypothetical protein
MFLSKNRNDCLTRIADVIFAGSLSNGAVSVLWFSIFKLSVAELALQYCSHLVQIRSFQATLGTRILIFWSDRLLAMVGAHEGVKKDRKSGDTIWNLGKLEPTLMQQISDVVSFISLLLSYVPDIGSEASPTLISLLMSLLPIFTAQDVCLLHHFSFKSFFLIIKIIEYCCGVELRFRYQSLSNY